MKGKRSKQYRKLMHAYQQTFNFRESYQVLCDAEILQDADRFTMDFVAGLKRTVQGEVKPMITQCSMRHLYEAKPKNDALIALAKRFERRRCNHHELEKPLSTIECISDVVDPKSSGTNKHKYVVATQDRELRSIMREKKGVPLIYINRSVMILEPMANQSVVVREREEKSKFRSGLTARPTVTKRKRDEDENEDEAHMVNGERAKQIEQTVDFVPAAKKLRKGPKGPNPLSVKKSTKRPLQDANQKRIKESTMLEEQTAGDDAPKKKRKRKHQHGAKEDAEVPSEILDDGT